MYIVLVGIPVVLLIGVLRMGERIPPPPYVGGIWRLEMDAVGEDSCAPPGVVEVIQSGTVLELHVDEPIEMRADARLNKGILHSLPFEGESPCSGVWALEAHRRLSPGSDRLVGRWIPAGCESCPSPGFEASRVPTEEM